MTSLKLFLVVGIGGFFGASLRFLMGQVFASVSLFPWATVMVNLLGSLLIRLFIGRTQNQVGADWFYFLVPGLLGGFTTFSSFSMEAVQHLQKGMFASFLSYLLLSVLGGIAACSFGFFLFRG